MQPSVPVQVGVGAEGLHHGLVHRPGVVGVVQDDVASRQHGLHVPVLLLAAGHQVAVIVPAHLTGREPVLLRVDQGGVVLGGAEIQHRLQHLVLHLDELHGLLGGLFGLGGNDGHRVPHEPQMPVQDQPVIGGGLRVGLARNGKAGGGHVLPGIDIHHPGDLFGNGGVDGLHKGVGVGAAQQLDHQGAFGGDVVGVHRLAQQKLQGVLLAHRLAHVFSSFLRHGAPPCGNPESGGCPAAALRSRSSGRGCRISKP